MQPQQGTPRRAASQPPVGAHPGLADLMHAAQRQPIPEVLAKFDDAYRDVGTTLRIFQERRRSSLAEQGPFTNIVAKLENDTPDDIFADTATTAAANGTAPPQPPIGSQNGGGAWDGSGMTVQSMPPSTSSGRPAAVAPIPSSTQPGSLNASQGVLTPARRSSISILAAANLVSQMAQVTAQASGTSTSEVMQAARRSSVSVQSDSAVRSRAAATGSSVRGSFAAGLNGDLRRSHSQGKDPRPANVTPAGHGSSPLVGGAQQQHTLFTSSGSGPSALISGAFMSAMSGNSDPIGTTTGNAAAHESMPIVPGALQPAFLDLELQSSPYQVPLTGPGSSMPVIAPPAMDPSGGSGGAVTSTYSLSHRPPAHLPPVIRAAPSVSSPFSPMGDAPYSPPPLPHVTPPMPVFQMAIIGGDGEVAKPAKPEMEFIPVTPKMDLGGVGGVGIDMPRSRSRTRSIGDNAMATIAADFLNGAHGGGTKLDTDGVAKKWKAAARKKKANERQRRLERGQHRISREVPDTIRLDMLREALPVVQKMITEYKKQLGDRDEITQQAIAHHWHLLRMLPKSHAYPEDGTVDPTTVTTEIQPAGSLPSTASGLGFKGFGRSASKAMDAGGAAGGTGKEKRVSDKPGVTSLVTNLMANVKMSAPWSPSTPDRPLRLDDILSEQDKGLASRLTPGIGR